MYVELHGSVILSDSIKFYVGKHGRLKNISQKDITGIKKTIYDIFSSLLLLLIFSSKMFFLNVFFGNVSV